MVAVVEGQADSVGDAEWAEVVRAPGSGDDTVVATARGLADAEEVSSGRNLLVVTADRGLRDRLAAEVPAAPLVGPRWLLDLLAR